MFNFGTNNNANINQQTNRKMLDFSSSNNNINRSNNPFNNFYMLNNKNLSKSVNQNTCNTTLQNNQLLILI